MENPLISVLMVFHNEEQYIHDSLKSIFDQDFSNFELILINDASTDNSVDILKPYLKDTRVVYKNFELKQGKSRCLNFGLEHSKGKYIAICDADDIYLKNRLSAPFNLLEKNKKISICGGQAILSTGKKAWENPVNHSKIKARMFFRNSLINSTTLIRKSFIAEHKLRYSLDFNRSEDYNFWMEALMQGAVFSNVHDSLIVYTIKRKSQGNTDDLQIEEANNIRKRLLKEMNIELDNETLDTYFKFCNFQLKDAKLFVLLKEVLTKEFNVSIEFKKAMNILWVEDLIAQKKSILTLSYWFEWRVVFSKKRLLIEVLKNIFK